MLTPVLLQSYIDDTSHSREKECQEYLERIPFYLCRETAQQLLVQGREQSSRVGYNDYCVSALISDGPVERRVAYVWEVKAPQSYIMEFDDHSTRLRPTKDMIKAETQLIHHVEEFRYSPSFRQWFNLGDRGTVVPAGIIIGSKQRLVKPSSKYPHNSAQLEKLYAFSMSMRDQYLYTKSAIVVKTWDWVHERFSQPSQGPQLI